MTRDAQTTIDQLREDLAASKADIEAGRIVSGEIVQAKIQDMLAKYEVEQSPDSLATAIHS